MLITLLPKAYLQRAIATIFCTPFLNYYYMIFTKESLQGRNYNWIPLSANILSDGFPTRKSFDRLSGDSMLRMINLFNLLISRLSLAEGRSMEQALTQELPPQLRSEVSVFNWLKHRYLYN